VFSRVLVANRGEIAVRVLRTLHALGIEGVAVYSDADVEAPHVRAADLAVRLGPAPAAESYLRVERVVAAARETGAEAVHPGYGFLSERPELPRACAEAGLAFVGPPADAMALLGDKAASKQAAAAAGVPVVPGLHGDALTDGEILDWAGSRRLPLLVKAVAGGGGKGMRVVQTLDEMPEALRAARSEARAAFGDDRLLVEQWIERPRHIEVQVIGDTHGNVIHLGERECSLQRRQQKVIEEAPSPVVDAELRQRMGAAAVELARSCGYTGAGTVEFIAAADDPSDFHFLEMNARLQVEHPVTEEVTGLDLVELQLRVAAGERLPLGQDEVALAGHAIEARIYAEDPANGFLPSSGRIVAWTPPAGARLDSGVEQGVEVTSHYDPLLAKLIAWGPDRAAALARLSRALGELRVVGPATNVSYLSALLERPDVRAGDLDTGLLERIGGELRPAPNRELPALAFVALIGTPASDDPWDDRDGWRPGERGWARARLSGPDGDAQAAVLPDGEGWYVLGEPGPPGDPAAGPGAPGDREDGPLRARLEHDGSLRVESGGLARRVDVYRDGDAVWLVDEGVPSRWAPAGEEHERRAVPGSLEAPMPGTVLDVRAEAGAEVREGEILLVLESMKMELTIASPFDGVVGDIAVRTGDRVARGQELAAVEPHETVPA
jgi:acetyl-CoA/propionyl-CoA carboxylase, biotin carboxylase, biotin carboxyl carrier protein